MITASWKDTTSYSQGQKEKKPKSWECKISELRIWVSCGHLHYPGRWVMSCRELNISTYDLGSADTMKIEQAQEQALLLFAASCEALAIKYSVAAKAARETVRETQS